MQFYESQQKLKAKEEEKGGRSQQQQKTLSLYYRHYGNSSTLTGALCFCRLFTVGVVGEGGGGGRPSAVYKSNMCANMSPGSINLESQLLSIMDVLVKTAVSEISQLFSENSASLCVQLTQSLRENQALRARMGSMRSELFSLRLQTRTNRPSSRFSQLRGHVPKPRAKPKGDGYFHFFHTLLPRVCSQHSTHTYTHTPLLC